MSSSRREVLVSKVLKRLYSKDIPCASNLHLQSKNKEPSCTGSEVSDDRTEPSLKAKKGEIVHLPTESSIDGENEFLDKQKVYTVSLPPEGCLPNFDNSCESSSSVDSENNEEAEGNAFRHRRRRKKKKGGIPPADPQTLQRKLHGETVKSGTINKNKRRKLQRKRQKERMKAAGLLPRAGAVDFVYQPEEGVPDKETLNKSSDQATEDQRKKSDELLDFFQATQEIYFADSKSKCSDSALSFDIVLDILSQIKNAGIPPSDVNMLHHLKTLLLLQDIERLKGALNDFKEHSVLPFDQRVTICSLLHYWITDILPIQNTK